MMTVMMLGFDVNVVIEFSSVGRRHLSHKAADVGKVGSRYCRMVKMKWIQSNWMHGIGRSRDPGQLSRRSRNQLLHHHELAGRAPSVDGARNFRAAAHFRTSRENAATVGIRPSLSIHLVLLQVPVQISLLSETALAQRAPILKEIHKDWFSLFQGCTVFYCFAYVISI